MRITRLDLHGFKSFADRTVFTFGPGISCVVGPNGCGKSNVIDGLRWCIGEQSARSLRGEDMQDVIFAGSAERKPVGYAEVAITFSSEGGDPFPGDYARYTEVQVARRLYRSGASEYLLNQTRVRRKDILDLLMDTGIGNDLYSFIEQGRIDKIVAASPEDRRALIDEAAGIVRYKKRREEARQKLEATATQLDRAADVSDEMHRRLQTLEKQVIKAARFRQLRALVRQEEIFLALIKQADLAATRDELGAVLPAMTERVVGLEGSVTAMTSDVTLRQGEVDVATAAADDARDALAELDAQRREAAAAASLHDQRATELAGQADRARQDLEADVARLATSEASGHQAEDELRRIDADLGGATSRAAALRSRLDEATIARDAARTAARSVESEAGTAAAERAERTARVEALRARAAELPQRLASVKGRLDAAADERIILDKRAAVARGVLEERSGRVGEIEQRRMGLAEAAETAVRHDLHARDGVRAAETDLDATQRALADAMAEAEASAGQADADVAARVGVVAAREENRVRDIDRAEARKLADAEEADRRQLGQVELGARGELERARREAEASLAGWRSAQEAELVKSDAAREAAVDAAMAEAGKRLDQAERDGAEEITRELASSRERREQADARLVEARAALQDAEATLAGAVRKRREAEGRAAALEAEEAALKARDAGGRAVAEALPDAKRLLDALRDAGVDPAPWSTVLGDRLLLPTVPRGQLTKAATAARAKGATKVVLGDRAASVDALTRGLSLVEDLDAALDGHAATGGVFVVKSTGERVDADGVVHLGQGSDAAGAAVARREALDACRAEIATHAAAVSEGEGGVTSARAKAEAASIGARKAAEAVDASERVVRERVAARLAGLRAEGEAALKVVRQQRVEGRSVAQAAFDAALKERIAARDAGLAEVRTRVEAGVDEARAKLVTDQTARRAAFEAGREARRAEVAALLETARSEAWDAVRATTADVAVRRERLREEVDTLRTALERARRRAEKLAGELAEAREALAAAQRERAAEDLVIVRVTAERDAADEARAALEQRVLALGSERTLLETSLAEVSAALAEQVALLEAAAARASDAEGALVAARVRLSERESAADSARAELDVADGALSALRERRASLEATVVAATSEREGATARIEAGRVRLGELELLRGTASDALREANVRTDRLAGERQEAVLKLDAARERLGAVREAYELIVNRLREDEAALTTARSELLATEQRHQAAVAGLEGLGQQIEERYQINLPGALDHLVTHAGLVLEPPDDVRVAVEVGDRRVDAVEALIVRPEMLSDDELVKDYVTRIEEHRRQLGGLGDVNLTALEEYTELAERYRELDAQRSDLDTSVNSLKSAIATLNRTCRDQFRETFDRVNEVFQKAYPDLVGGGEARLELTNEEDLLETGVEVIVRPPGKRLQTLSLLSGGEKAMTAIALLLALFTVKPSPFCVLDEVDAPLDEANGARFNDMLRLMSTKTQFLVVTHNRKTMECADTLYGVTMPTPGCSAVVSVRVD